ncbi:hypothetical protein [Streptomyces varsoviensis]|nr:hypothetical protein [Streptomyces varsoviensis]
MEPETRSEAREALAGLVRWESPLRGLIQTASRYDQHARNSDIHSRIHSDNSVTLDRRAVRSVLERCLSGVLDVKELPEWAFAVHMADGIDIGVAIDVGDGGSDEAELDLLAQFLFEVSSPELFEPVTADVCRRWLGRMG